MLCHKEQEIKEIDVDLFCRYEPSDGYTPLVKPAQMGLKLIEFGVINLQPGQICKMNTEQNEVILVILAGKSRISSGVNEWTDVGKRKSVFDGKPYSAYIPSGSEFTVTALEETQIAVCRAPANSQRRERLITPDDLNVLSRGEDNCYRDVYEIANLGRDAESIMVGETISGPGNWCSWPPHKHDFEEIYFYKMDQSQGFGIQRVYTDDRKLDELYVIENNTMVTIPRGYHPLVVAPPYRVWFLYVIARNDDQPLHASNDPVHTY